MATTVKARITAGINVVTNKTIADAVAGGAPEITVGSAPWITKITEVASYTKAYVGRHTVENGTPLVLDVFDGSLSDPQGDSVSFPTVSAVLIRVEQGPGTCASELGLHTSGGAPTTFAIFTGSVNLAFTPGGFATGSDSTLTFAATTGEDLVFTIVILGA